MGLRIGCIWLLVAAPAMAQGPPEGWQPAPESRLEEARGGFLGSNGILLSLGVERLVEVNGVVVARQRTDLADMARLGSVAEAMAPMVVQNEASGQLIRSLTTIDLTVNALSTLKSLNLESNLRQALSNVIVPR